MKKDLHMLLNKHKESINVDYKEKVDFKENKIELIKDIIAFANAEYIGSKYIVYGVSQKGHCFENVGLKSFDFNDESTYQNLVHDKIEPYIPLIFHKIEYNGLLFLIIEIKSDIEKRPYMVKSKYVLSEKRKILEGDSYIRKGTVKKRMLRADFVDIFNKNKNRLEIDLQHNELFILDQNPATLDLIIRNYSDITKLFTEVVLEICNSNGEYITDCKMHGIKINGNVYKGTMESDFTLSISRQSEVYGLGMFSFSSTQAMQVGLDEYGEGGTYIFKLHLRNTKDEPLTFIYPRCTIFGKGAVLWKIKSSKKSILRNPFKK